MNDRDVAEKMAQSSGLVGESTEQCTTIEENLSGRLRNKYQRAQQESRRVLQLDELLYLLNKNPEVARILDLIDMIGDKY